MYDVAGSQFRRAVYLNPFEPRFKRHLAWCLFKQGKPAEARAWIANALEQNPDERDARFILAKIEESPDASGRTREEKHGEERV